MFDEVSRDSGGGRLQHLAQNWEMILTDQWVLSIIKEGYKLEFI